MIYPMPDWTMLWITLDKDWNNKVIY